MTGPARPRSPHLVAATVERRDATRGKVVYELRFDGVDEQFLARHDYVFTSYPTLQQAGAAQRQGAAGSPLQLLKRIGWCAALRGGLLLL